MLETLGLQSAIHLNRYRTEKKDRSEKVWMALKQSPGYRAVQRERYKIGRKYGEAKEHHGLG